MPTIHPAIEYFRQLQLVAPSSNLKNFLSSFDEPRSIDSQTFTEGVKKFIKLANCHPLNHSSGFDRETWYGNCYSGLHYDNDLVKLWNSSHAEDEVLKSSQVSTLAPSEWDSVLQDGFTTLIYRGQHPAQALDQLIIGPTVIDCGMFVQLSIWFGIRYLLGNERFNQCFQRAPFFVTQCVYQDIEESDKPYFGNPLASFLSTTEQAIIPSVTIKYLANSPLYPLKHPGGNYLGDNCIVIDGRYYIWDPLLENTEELTESAILDLLRQAFNEEQSLHDTDRLSFYASDPDHDHPKFRLTYGGIIEMAKFLRDKQLTEKEFHHVAQDHFELTFDLHKFSMWLQAMESNRQVDPIDYAPLPIDYSLFSTEFLNVIPFENKLSMDFSKFKQDTLQQKELITVSKQFCQNRMNHESKLVILSGKAGIGKTAAAICAAKELVARGKKVVWISEVMVNGWADQAKSIEDLNQCRLEIDKLLASNPDAVFLEDDNLGGYSGNLLLEKIYSWYVTHPRKGLFITSNGPIHFTKCYGYNLDDQYHYPPFIPYHSPQYVNQQIKMNLEGKSLRSKREGQSIGAIVSDTCWKNHEGHQKHVEFVPAFDEDKELAPIRRSLRQTGMKGQVYDKLRPIQKKWLDQYEVRGGTRFRPTFFGGWETRYEESHLTVNPKQFEKSIYQTIAIEIQDFDGTSGKKIDYYSMQQLIRVLNYAHDQGGRRIILINQTSFSAEQLLAQINIQLPEAERERTWSRVMLLFCEIEDSIFKYEEFDGYIEENLPKKNLLDDTHHANHDTDVKPFSKW